MISKDLHHETHFGKGNTCAVVSFIFFIREFYKIKFLTENISKSVKLFRVKRGTKGSERIKQTKMKSMKLSSVLPGTQCALKIQPTFFYEFQCRLFLHRYRLPISLTL